MGIQTLYVKSRLELDINKTFRAPPCVSTWAHITKTQVSSITVWSLLNLRTLNLESNEPDLRRDTDLLILYVEYFANHSLKA